MSTLPPPPPETRPRMSAIAQMAQAAMRQPQAGEKPYMIILRQVRQRIQQASDPYELAHPSDATRAKLVSIATQVIQDYRMNQPIQGLPILELDDAEVVARLTSDILGYGPLDPLLRNEDIEEIIINGTQIWVIDERGKHTVEIPPVDPDGLVEMLNRLVAPSGRQVTAANPILDAQLPDGSRLNITIAPIAMPSPAATIRRHRLVARRVDDLIARNSISDSVAAFLKAAIQARLGILIAGGTASGKTNFLNVLASLLPPSERVVVIEDTRELQLPIPDVVYQTVRYPSAEGVGEIPQRRLVQNALRMRPDRIVVGEVRGAETIDMLLAANTGHEGFLASVHANSAIQAVTRLIQLTKLSPEGSLLDEKTICEWIAEAFHLIIFLKRDAQGARYVEEILELTGSVEGNRVLSQPLFRREHGNLVRTNYPIARADRFRERGVDPTPFAPTPRVTDGAVGAKRW